MAEPHISPLIVVFVPCGMFFFVLCFVAVYFVLTALYIYIKKEREAFSGSVEQQDFTLSIASITLIY